MEWLSLGQGQSAMSMSNSPSNSGAMDIAQQLQNLLQIPAIEKKALPGIQSTSSQQNTVNQLNQHFAETSIANAVLDGKTMPMYCSDLEAKDFGPQPQLLQQKEGKENSFPGPVSGSGSRGQGQTGRGRGRGQGGGRTEGHNFPIQPTLPPVISRRFQNSKPTKREVQEYRLSEYLKHIGYGLPKPANRVADMYSNDHEFPSFIEMTTNLEKGHEIPGHFYDQEDLFARNAIKLDGIENIGEHWATLDVELKTLLRFNFVEALSRKNMKYPKAKFVCYICPYHLETLIDVMEHVSLPWHRQSEREHFALYTLENVPMASEQQCEAIGRLISNISHQHALTECDMKQRVRIMKFLKDVFTQNEIDCEVSVFGSTACDLALSFSDLNINVTFGSTDEMNSLPTARPVVAPSSTQHLNGVARVIDILMRVPQFREVKPKYLMNKTHITFIAKEFGGSEVPCLIQFNNKPALQVAGLFNEYVKINSMVRPILRAFRYWARVCKIDDQENGWLPAHAYTIMAIQYLQETRMIPVLQAVPRVDASRPFATSNESFKAGFPNHSQRPYSHAELGKLWLSLLYYYAVKFDYSARVVTISRSEVFRNCESAWNRKICIEDPIIPSCNVSRSTSNNKICDFILESIKKSFLYFAIPRTKDYGPLYDGIMDDRLVEDPKRVFLRHVILVSGTTQFPMKQVVDSVKVLPASAESSENAAYFKMVSPDDQVPPRGESFVLRTSLSVAHSVLATQDYFYDFSNAELASDNASPETCKACGSERHIRRDCPEESLPPLTAIQRPSSQSLLMLRKIIILNYEKLALDEPAYKARLQIKNHVLSLLVKDFPNVQLTMFGSSESGFGLQTSDLDLCMTLRNMCFQTKDDILRYIDANDTLTKVVASLKCSTELRSVFSITTAKVPIVKYFHGSSNLEGDISFYNLLALRNTLLLKAYNQLDARVKVLGCLIKKLGKVCEISDASKGSISSYAYMLMLIHYLQHTKKPVLPVLQEIPPLGHPPNEPLPTYVVESNDSYFFDDLSKMQYAWKGYGQNTEPVEELWLGFLRYYTEVFDFDNHVVAISRYSPVTRKEKAWYTNCIAIEDPFDKCHNLGSGLSRRMSVHIIKTLRKFRTVFHSDVNTDDIASARMHYFNRNALRQGKLPIDRQCRICHKIGHIARNCQRQQASDTESLYGDDDEDELPTTGRPTEQGVMNETNRNQPWVDNIEKVAVSSRNVDMPNLSQQSLNLQQKEAEDCVVDDIRYFWNIDQPQNPEEILLEKMINSSPGVSFSTYLKDKAITMKASSTAPSPSNEENDNIYHLLPQTNCNGVPQINPLGGALILPHHSMGIPSQGAHNQLGMPQSRCSVAGSGSLRYPPPGIVQLPPPPPGFAPLEPPRLPMAPSMVPNGMVNENIQRHNIPHPMYRFAGFGQYMNVQQLPQNIMMPINGALNRDMGQRPPIINSMPWVNSHIPEQQAHQWDANRH